jgi:OmpA-OmpF porin, OOP family
MTKHFYIHFLITVLLSAALLHTTELTAQKLYFARSVPLSDTLNSDSEESLPFYSPQDSTLFFVRTLHPQNTGGTLSGQDIWYSKRDTAGNWTKPTNDIPNLNNEGNNAVVGLSESGNTIYLLNDYSEGNQQQPGLSLSFSRDNNWRLPNSIFIPGLSDKQGIFYSLYMLPTEDVVLISAQMDNSLGQEDLYVSTKDPLTNEWSAPIHLGPTVNTGGFEISPYLTADKTTLFFSSNGHPGYGNADIFVTQRMDTSWTRWTKPENLGDQINSVGFDAYFTTNEDREVFFVSNRRGTSADIFTSRIITEEERELELAQRIQGGGRGAELLGGNNQTSLDPETQALIDETRALLEEFNTMRDGESPVIRNPSSTSDAPTFISKRVLFNLNASSIRSSFTTRLDEVVSTLNENPQLKVEIVGHADDTGGKDYNLKLSIDRAVAVKQYLIRNGISERRIITYGKGSTQPLSDNQTPEAQQRNRRVEINFI